MASSTAPHTGTTIVACTFEGGVVLGADGRVSTGRYVSNRASNKIAEITDNTFLLRSGSAADCEAIANYVTHFASQLECELGHEPTVKSVATLVRQMNYNNKHLIGACIVAGWDKWQGGQVFGCPIGGTITPQPWTTDGSGSTYIWGFLDSAYKPNMTRSEAEEVVREALALAMSTDGSSGGIIRLITCTEEGVFKQYVGGESVPVYGGEMPLRPAEVQVIPNDEVRYCEALMCAAMDCPEGKIAACMSNTVAK